MKSTKAARWILLAAAIVFISAGLLRGEYRDALNKAIYICLECIGIG